MDPKDFDWSSDQQVTVTNPTAEDFAFKVYGKEYVVESGSTVKMPGYIAWIYTHKISVKEAQKDGGFINWNDKGSRQEYYRRFVIGSEELVQIAKPEPKFERLDTPMTEEHEGVPMVNGVPLDTEEGREEERKANKEEKPAVRGRRGRAQRDQ